MENCVYNLSIFHCNINNRNVCFLLRRNTNSLVHFKGPLVEEILEITGSAMATIVPYKVLIDTIFAFVCLHNDVFNL
jgi:hypothetical protein